MVPPATSPKVVSFPSAEAKPIVLGWLQEILVPAGYTLTKTRIYKQFDDMIVKWRITTPWRINTKGPDILNGISINLVLEEWFPDIIERVKLPYCLGGAHKSGRKEFVNRWDEDFDNTGPIIFWDVFSRTQLEALKYSIQRVARDWVAFFEKRADPREYLLSAFGLFPNGGRRVEDQLTGIVALYRIAKSEGVRCDLFRRGVETWHQTREENLAQTELELSTAPAPWQRLKYKHATEELQRRITDPLYNHDVLLRDENNLFRTLAVALGQPEESWTMTNRLTGVRP
jgi:hypothetical protein